ncbi:MULTISPECIES: ABC transporter permease [unclassified Arthrobacter]|uniref:ABC transporter permease n=1 Tax=unclassified Arthrobacter TaxID=235627 RepID=UPI001D14A423|nr:MULTISPECIES: ABC transporter permease [unclassified Arthrobacter]MCC3290369.1 ABC transporter permease [Arthrobacter sp. zg-Y1110]MCC3300118.1 ABC transporter permease [Arthrobacter sp. zg-Y895]MCC9173232.1 ABC transporter permease [Arthrobacter sp. zg-Y179]MCQ1945500.1 ABC transporter permease [Arthrobacter sp. zg-Y1116]MCQ1985447.1 ABC transporter permease [Arthrobacter sp. zg-Y844]
MAGYVIRRFLQMIPVFFGATFLVYFLVFSLPGDPIAALFGDKPVNEAVAAQLRSQYNLDQPFIVQYLLYLKNLVTFNLGVDFSGREVSAVLAQAFPVTMRLAVLALLFEAVFGIAFGLMAGLKKGKIFDSTVLVVSLIVIAIPVFVLGFLLQFLVGVKLQWTSPTVGGDASWADLILPAVVLGLASFAYVLRLTRTSVIENMNADYVRTATAKGLSRPRVVTVHILRNSLIPVVTFLGADLGALMGGAIVTEGIFNVPGVGQRLYQSVIRGEGPTIVSIVSVLVFVYVIANLLVDLLYAWLDPRIRYA